MATLTFSQGIVSHAESGGSQNFLIINGDKVDIHAPIGESLVSIFAHRDTNYLLTLQADSDIQSWGYGSTSNNNAVFDNINGGGTSTNEYYLWIDINRATGAISYGHSINEPSAGTTPPFSAANRPDNLHWFDTNNKIMKVWTANGIFPLYGSWTEVVRVFVAKYVFSASFASLSVNSPSFIGTQAGILGPTKAGALLYDVGGKPVLRTDSNNVSIFFTTEDIFVSGLPIISGNRARYETFLVDAIGQTPMPAFSMVRFSGFNKILPLNALGQANDMYGMIEFPVGASGDLVQVTLSGAVRNPLWDWSTVNQQIYVDKDNDGLLVTVEDDSYVPLPDQLPIGIAIDKTTLLIRRPELALTAPSTSGGVTDHTALTNIGVNTHPQIDTHITTANSHFGNATIHFTEASIDHLNISNIGTNSHALIDTHIADASIHFTEASISHLNIGDIGTNSHAAIDSHIGDSTIHFTEASIDHDNILNNGTNTHIQIDAHMAAGNIHFTEASISHLNIGDIGTNSHAAIDSHISNTNIHTALTVGEVNGSPTTTVSNVNTILFNTVSGFDVVDQTGGVVQIDLNSSFNPIIVQGGSPEQTLTASGEEPLKLVAGTNVTLTGNAGSTPKEITISATGGGGIQSRIQDGDNDTFIETEVGGTNEILISTGATGVFGLATSLISIKSDAIEIGGANFASPEFPIPSSGTGSKISLVAGPGSVGGVGGTIVLTSGPPGTLSGGGAGGTSGGITLFVPDATDGTTDSGGSSLDIVLNGGDGGDSAGNNGGIGSDIKLTAGKGGTATAGTGDGGDGGDIILTAGSAGDTIGGVNGDPGNIVFKAGSGQGAGPDGSINILSNDEHNNAVDLRFYEPTDINYVGFKAPATLSGNTIWTLPTTDGSGGQALTTNGAGILSWASAGGTPSRMQDGDNDTFIDVDAGGSDSDDIVVQTGLAGTIVVNSGTGSASAGGIITVTSGDGSSGFGGGVVTLATGNGGAITGSGTGGSGGKFTIQTGIGGSSTAGSGGNGGGLDLIAQTGGNAPGSDAGRGGDTHLYAGDGGTGILPGYGGEVVVRSGDGRAGGDILIASGNNIYSGYNAGNIILEAGTGIGTEGQIQIRRQSGSEAGILFFMDNNNSNSIALAAPGTVSTNRTWVLPDDNPATVSGQFITTDASGNLSFAAGGGGGASDRIEDGDADTFVDTDVSSDNKVHFSTGQTGNFIDTTDVVVIGSNRIDIGGFAGTPTLNAPSAGTGAAVALNAGPGGPGSQGGALFLYSGNPGAASGGFGANSGGINLTVPDAQAGTTGLGGLARDIQLYGGLGGDSTGGNGGAGSTIKIVAAAGGDSTNAVAGAGGSVIIQAGAGGNTTTGTLGAAGDITLRAGSGIGAAADGAVRIMANIEHNVPVDLRFHSISNAGYVGFKAPGTIVGNTVWTLPDDDGSSGDVMQTNGAGVLTWVANSGGGGSTTYLGLTDTPSSFAGDEGKFLRVAKAGSPTTVIHASLPYDVSGAIIGVPTVSTHVFRYAVNRALTLNPSTGLPGRAFCDSATQATTSTATFDIHTMAAGTAVGAGNKIGTITFTTGTSTGTVAYTGSPSVDIPIPVSNEIVIVYATADSGGTLGNISFTLEGVL